jgi:hypothetical protein
MCFFGPMFLGEELLWDTDVDDFVSITNAVIRVLGSFVTGVRDQKSRKVLGFFSAKCAVLENQGHMRKRILGYADGNSCSRRSVIFNGAFLLLTKRLLIIELFEQLTLGCVGFRAVH